jgi:trans-2,3-dihydro-3-hydroxyanthranilate isomerase
MPHALTWLDVFTAEPLRGNGLAVVHDADGVSDETMLAFARETRLSETTFVQAATESGADYRNRIWMTQGELPFAGHPSLGTAVAVARARGEREARYVQQTGVGLQPIEVEAGERVARASMLQEPASFGAEVEAETALRALGLDMRDGAPHLAPQVVGTGLPQLIVPVREAAALDRVAPDAPALRAVLEGPGCVCAYVAFLDPDRESASARSFFVDGGAALEDPATGAAAGPLMAYANAHTGAARLTIDQGVAMGRPSRLLCEAGERVRVTGDAVVVFQATVDL